MARITEEDRQVFFKHLDNAIKKLETEKNIKKVHWNKLSLEQLNKMLMIEAHELDLAIMNEDNNEILSECDDIINFAMFIKDNVSNGFY